MTAHTNNNDSELSTIMVLIAQRIKAAASKKRIPLRQLAVDIGMTDAGFHKSLKGGNLKAKTLILISQVLEVSPCFLITGSQEMDTTDPGTDQGQTTSSLEKRVYELEAALRLINVASLRFND